MPIRSFISVMLLASVSILAPGCPAFYDIIERQQGAKQERIPMPDPRQITDLPVAPSAADADLLLMRQGATDTQVTAASIRAPLMRKSANLSDVASVSTARTNLAVAAASATLLKADNLSGLGDAGDARNNLGLGTAAVEDIGTGTGEIPLAEDVSGLVERGTQIITASGDFTVPAGVTQLEIDLWTGGGGGGGGATTSVNGNNGTAGGDSSWQKNAGVVTTITGQTGGVGGHSNGRGGEGGDFNGQLGGVGYNAAGIGANRNVPPYGYGYGGAGGTSESADAGGGGAGGTNHSWFILAVVPGDVIHFVIGTGGEGGAKGGGTAFDGEDGGTGCAVVRW